MPETIYFDNNATTKPLPEVVEAMLPFLQTSYANPSSLHQFGQEAKHKLECARANVAQLIHAAPKEIIFTSGGTESINVAIRGALRALAPRRRIVTTAVEHTATLAVMKLLEADGFDVQYVGVDRNGKLDEERWEQAIDDQTAMVSIIHTNNETGVIFDVARHAELARDRGAIVHVDAVQSAGKLSINVHDWPVDLLSLSAHKFHGPKGIGALYIKRRTRLESLIVGGSQERELRGGTENVAGAVGMGVAADIAARDSGAVADSVGTLRDMLEQGILETVPVARVNGAGAPRIYNTTNISFAGLEPAAVLILLSGEGICASSGSACSSGSLERSHVLDAMGVGEEIAHGAIRWSLSRFNTSQEVKKVLELLPKLVFRLSALAKTGS